jgi:hypothetical protein
MIVITFFNEFSDVVFCRAVECLTAEQKDGFFKLHGLCEGLSQLPDGTTNVFFQGKKVGYFVEIKESNMLDGFC